MRLRKVPLTVDDSKPSVAVTIHFKFNFIPRFQRLERLEMKPHSILMSFKTWINDKGSNEYFNLHIGHFCNVYLLRTNLVQTQFKFYVSRVDSPPTETK